VAATHHDAVRFVPNRSGGCEQVFMITGIGVHDRLELVFTITGIRILGPRQRPPAALSGQNPKAPGSAGGYLLADC
jgi:hypothetical protein